MKKRIIIGLAVFTCVAAVGCGPSKPSNQTTNATANQTAQTPPSPKHHVKKTPVSPTTGLPLKHTASSLYFSAMIENSPNARPQTGLDSADIVYEMEAEGTITRYIAIFHDNIPALVGPMRSARPYFVQTARDWGTPYIHYGGAPEAYQMLKTYPYPQIDGIYQGQYFSRDPSRVAPHNAYLHTDTLPHWKVKIQNHHWTFGTPNVSSAKTVDKINIDFNSFTQVSYVYQPKTHEYLRYQQGAPDDDRVSGKQIYTDNIILQYTNMAPIPHDPKGRITIDLNGPGQTLYFEDGKEFKGTWKRDSNGVVEYLDAHGKLMKLRPGKTWVEVVSDAVPVSAPSTNS